MATINMMPITRVCVQCKDDFEDYYLPMIPLCSNCLKSDKRPWRIPKNELSNREIAQRTEAHGKDLSGSPDAED